MLTCTSIPRLLCSALHLLLACLMLVNVAIGCPSELCSCSARGVIICSRRRLERVPHFARELDKIYEELDLSRNEVYAIPPYAFEDLKVRSIILSHNPLIGISPRAMDGVHVVLEKLDLSATTLDVLHWGVFRKLVKLQDLDISGNNLFAIPIGLFDGLRQLQHLSVAWNKVSTIRHGVFRGLKTLNHLELLGNRITHLDDEIFNDLRELKWLDLKNNAISYIGRLTFRGMENLERLEIDDNHLVDLIPSTFAPLHSLKHLSLSRNNISIIPPRAWFGADRLDEILLAQNNIYNISSDAFLGLDFLKVISLAGNKLETLGEDCVLRGVDSVVALRLEDNPLECSCRLSWIHKLSTRGCKVSGHCDRPDQFKGSQLSQLNFTLCANVTCT